MVVAGWFYLLSPELGVAKHLPVDADPDKENATPGVWDFWFTST